MAFDTTYLIRYVATLDLAYKSLLKADPDSIEYALYRSATIKEFEIILEQSGKLLRKLLKPYFPSNAAIDRMPFKEVFRQATIHQLLEPAAVERWFAYSDNRNALSHDYGKQLAENTLPLLPPFVEDVEQLIALAHE